MIVMFMFVSAGALLKASTCDSYIGADGEHVYVGRCPTYSRHLTGKVIVICCATASIAEAQKGAHFVQLCGQRRIPLLSLGVGMLPDFRHACEHSTVTVVYRPRDT